MKKEVWFAWLMVAFAVVSVHGQDNAGIAYGNNPAAGHYLNVGDARIYYEVYGQGSPVVLLHGGLFGYIDEYEQLIPKLAARHRVIAIAARGHGKSEVGTKPYTYELMADDAYRVIKSITRDSVVVIGFSTGGNTAYYLAARHPEMVKKLVGIGASPLRSETKNVSNEEKLTGDRLAKDAPDFVKSRKQLMPDPARWNDFVEKIVTMWDRSDFLTEDQLRGFKCPVLIIAGDKDPHVNVDRAAHLFRLLPNSRLSLVPGCEHVVMYCNFPVVWESLSPFVN